MSFTHQRRFPPLRLRGPIAGTVHHGIRGLPVRGAVRRLANGDQGAKGSRGAARDTPYTPWATRPSLRHARAARRLLRFHIPACVPTCAGSLPGQCTDGALPPGSGCRDLGRGQQNTQPTPPHRGPVMCGGRLPRVARLRADSRTVVRPFDRLGEWILGSATRARRRSAKAQNAPSRVQCPRITRSGQVRRLMRESRQWRDRRSAFA